MIDKDVSAELAEIIAQENIKIQDDVITRTIIKLIGIEREALYGINRAKKSKLEAVINEELSNFISGR